MSWLKVNHIILTQRVNEMVIIRTERSIWNMFSLEDKRKKGISARNECKPWFQREIVSKT